MRRNSVTVLLAFFLVARPWLAAAELPFAPTAANTFPPPGATSVCPDTPLRLTLSAPAKAGAAGKLVVHDAANGTAVATIDLAQPVATQSIGGLANYNYYTAIFADRQVSLHLPHGALAYGKTYYVTLDAGAITVGDDTIAALRAPTAWRFTTKSAPPARGTTRVTIAADGTGDFCTVQGAIDFVPDGNATPTTLFVRRGTYTEIVFVTNKHALTLLGEDRKSTVIAYPNNDKFNNNSAGNPFGGPSPDPAAATLAAGPIYRRGMFTAHRCTDLTIANLTLRNTTPHGGSQAEAIILNGTTTARAILKEVDLYSFQDTLQINGQAYLAHCYLEGDVDFMWGTGPCFWEDCHARSLRTGAYYTQIRNPPTNHGYVYLRCTFDGAPGVTGNFLTRVEPSRFPASEVVLLDCTLTDAVSPIGWQLQAARGGAMGDTTRLHFWEANSRNAAARPIDASQRLAVSRQLSPATGDTKLIADYRDPTFVLGGNWNPRAAPIFTRP
ncbi:MAG: Ig-like domain-containing protein [Verrucomicrobia bacterium]|nr:Ig-like domain-containing protein [Verrucomicrobiota bacterium]